MIGARARDVIGSAYNELSSRLSGDKAGACCWWSVFSALSWNEILKTICEHLEWVTPAGRHKVSSCAHALEKLEGEG